MTVSPGFRKQMRRCIAFVRLFGWTFAAFASFFILFGILMLFDPQAVVTVNGVPRTDMTAKLSFALFPLLHLGVGLFCALAPKSWLMKVMIYHEDKRRRFAARFPGPIRKLLGG
jgi:hypothetical protein